MKLPMCTYMSQVTYMREWAQRRLKVKKKSKNTGFGG